MAFEPFVFVLLGGFLVALAVGILTFVSKRRRRQAYEAFASQIGFDFEPRSTEGLERSLVALAAINQGHSRAARNVLRGAYRGIDLRAFDYHYTTGSGKHQQHHRTSVCVAFLPPSFPNLTIVPETWDKKLWDALGGDDIDFESDEFSRKFWVKCPDRRFAYDVIHPRAMELLLAPGWNRWQLVGPYACVWSGGLLRPSEWTQVFDRLLAFLALLPAPLRPAIGDGRRPENRGGRPPIIVRPPA